MTEQNLEATAPAEETAMPEAQVSEEGAQEPPAPSSRRDSIQKAFESLDMDENAEASEEASTTPPDAERLRGPDGKFIAKGKASDDAEGLAAAKVQDGAQPALSDPPSRFSPDAKEAWKDAPDAVKGEIKRAITEMENGLAQKDAQIAPLKPFFDMAQQHGTTVETALGNYVRMEQLLAKDMTAGLTELAKNFGMTLDQMIERATGKAPQGAAAEGAKDQHISELQKQIQTLQQQIGGVTKTVQQSTEQAALKSVQDFAVDKPRFEELAPEITRMLETGFASDLSDAYEKAERLNPAPQPAAPAAQTPPPVQTRKAKSVTGAPSAGSDPGSRQPSKSRTEAIERALSQVGL